MATVAIVSEYNPFHNGHLYQVEQIRKILGQDTCIIAIMSGNFTQRGEIAIADKGLRAKCAVEAGVNLVLELPFPFSLSSAEFFAKSAVSIIDRLGVVDYICFGCETDDKAVLVKVAKTMLGENYIENYENIKQEKRDAGHPAVSELALHKTDPTLAESFVFSSNNILAIEYIKALFALNSKIEPMPILRRGADYNEQNIINSTHQSATAIRNAINKKDISALEFIPVSSKKIILNAIADGDFPTDENKLGAAVISFLRLNSPSNKQDIHDVGGGLYNRLQSASNEANTMTDLVRLSETKKYTTARIRRAIYYSFFGVTSSEVKEIPMYTQVLAMDQLGRMRLKSIRKQGLIDVLTKPADAHKLCAQGQLQKKTSDRADSIFQLTKPIPREGGYSLKFTPYVKKGE